MSSLQRESSKDIWKDPATWSPDGGTVVQGRILGYRWTPTPDGGALACIIQDEESRSVAVPLDTPLLAEFRHLDPKAGDTIEIQCTGRHPQRGCLCFEVLMGVETQANG